MTLEQWSDYFSDWCNDVEVVFWETKAANTRRELSKSTPTYYAKITKNGKRLLRVCSENFEEVFKTVKHYMNNYYEINNCYYE